MPREDDCVQGCGIFIAVPSIMICGICFLILSVSGDADMAQWKVYEKNKDFVAGHVNITNIIIDKQVCDPASKVKIDCYIGSVDVAILNSTMSCKIPDENSKFTVKEMTQKYMDQHYVVNARGTIAYKPVDHKATECTFDVSVIDPRKPATSPGVLAIVGSVFLVLALIGFCMAGGNSGGGGGSSGTTIVICC
jgi:hypothetical protein